MDAGYVPGARLYCVHLDGNKVLKFGLCRAHLEAIRDDGWPEEPEEDDEPEEAEEPEEIAAPEPEPEPVIIKAAPAPAPQPVPRKHGKLQSWLDGCRCDLCVGAHLVSAQQKVKRDPEPEHGTQLRYVKYRCRCHLCRSGHSDRNRAYRETHPDLPAEHKRERIARAEADPSILDGRHGLDSTYSGWGCRCEPCTEAHRSTGRATYARLQAKRKAAAND